MELWTQVQNLCDNRLITLVTTISPTRLPNPSDLANVPLNTLRTPRGGGTGPADPATAGPMFSQTMVLDKHQTALSVPLRGYIATYWGPGSRESLFTSPVAMQQNLKCLDTYRALVEYDGEQLRADYHVRFRKGWS